MPRECQAALIARDFGSIDPLAVVTLARCLDGMLTSLNQKKGSPARNGTIAATQKGGNLRLFLPFAAPQIENQA